MEKKYKARCNLLIRDCFFRQQARFTSRLESMKNPKNFYHVNFNKTLKCIKLSDSFCQNSLKPVPADQLLD